MAALALGMLGAGLLAGGLGAGGIALIAANRKPTNETRLVESDCSWIQRSYEKYSDEFRTLEVKLRRCDNEAPETERQLQAIEGSLMLELDGFKDVKVAVKNERIKLEKEMSDLKKRMAIEIDEMNNRLQVKKSKWAVVFAEQETEDGNVIGQLRSTLDEQRRINDEEDEKVRSELEKLQQEHFEAMERRKQEMFSQIENFEHEVLDEPEQEREKREVGNLGNVQELSGKDLLEMVNEQRNAIGSKGLLCFHHNDQSLTQVPNIDLLCNNIMQLS